MTPQEIMQKLQAPFLPEDVEWRVDRVTKFSNNPVAYVLAYITNRAIQTRLDDIFGPFGWYNEFREWKSKGQLCGLSIYCDQVDGWKWVTKWDGADDSNFEATKGGLSDSMKRAAVQWGIGRYLYSLEQYKVSVLSSGQHYVNAETKKGSNEWVTGYWNEPRLPGWALPEGYKYPATMPQSAPPPPKAPAATPSTPKANTPPQEPKTCFDCDCIVTDAEYGFSQKKYNRPLCRKCQDKAKNVG
jgi:hypothetical protein